MKIPWQDLANKPTYLKLDGLSINAEVTDTVNIEDIDELEIKRNLLDSIESKRDSEADFTPEQEREAPNITFQ